MFSYLRCFSVVLWLVFALPSSAFAQFQLARLTASDGETGDRFGAAVAIDGDTIAVGAPYARCVYVFREVGGNWIQEARLVAPSLADSEFGSALDVEGNRLVVGAPGSLSGSSGQPRVYWYRRAGTFPFSVWSLQGSLVPPGSIDVAYGYSIAIEGGSVAIGHGPAVFNGGVPSPVHVFQLAATGATHEAALVFANAFSNEGFGASLDWVGDTLLVGAPLAVGNAGRAYLFNKVGGAWGASISIPNPYPGGYFRFGSSVSLANSMAAIGLPNYPGGALAAFAISPAGGVAIGSPIASSFPGSNFGQTVRVSGSYLLSVVPGTLPSSGSSGVQGRCGVFQFNGTTWTLAGAIASGNPTQDEQFGCSLDADNSRVVVGALTGNGRNPGSGTVLVYSLVPPPPVVHCTPKLNSAGCLARMASSGVCALSNTAPFLLSASSALNNKFGLLFFGVEGRANFPFQGGYLCVLPPTRRTNSQGSGGSAQGTDCSGSYSFDFNALVRSGAYPELAPGALVNAQYWYRDPQAASTTGLTDAVEFGVGF